MLPCQLAKSHYSIVPEYCPPPITTQPGPSPNPQCSPPSNNLTHGAQRSRASKTLSHPEQWLHCWVGIQINPVMKYFECGMFIAPHHLTGGALFNLAHLTAHINELLKLCNTPNICILLKLCNTPNIYFLFFCLSDKRKIAIKSWFVHTGWLLLHWLSSFF